MRFAWQRQQQRQGTPLKKGFTHPINLVLVAYNVVWWVPIILGFTKVIDYRAAFIAFLAVTAMRLVANIIRNNVLASDKAAGFPLRSP